METSKETLKELEQAINSMTNKFVELNNTILAGRVTTVTKTEILNLKKQLEVIEGKQETDRREVSSLLNEINLRAQQPDKSREPEQFAKDNHKYILFWAIILVIAALSYLLDKRQQNRFSEITQQVKFLSDREEAKTLEAANASRRYPVKPNQKQPQTHNTNK